MAEGIIYVLTNEAMPGYVKIGKTEGSVSQRIKGLDGTSLPFPFECYYAARVADLDKAEKLVHDAFDDVRVTPRREFFTIDPERARSAIRLAEIEDVTPTEEDVVESTEDRAALDKAKKRRRNASFEMIGIEPGAVLAFSKDPSISCVVVSDKKVKFEGEEMSVSASAHKVIKRLGYDWPAVNGWHYWLYEGQTLRELYNEALEGA